MFWTETLEVDIEGMTRTHASSNWYIQELWTLHLLLLIFFKRTWGEGLWWSTSPRAPPYKTIRRLAWLGTSQTKTYVNGYWSNWRRHFHIDYKGFFCFWCDLLPQRSAVARLFCCCGFFDLGHPRFWNFYSITPIEVVGWSLIWIASLTLRI